jgi:hypothetical protein
MGHLLGDLPGDLHARVFDANPDGHMPDRANRGRHERWRNLILAIADGDRILPSRLDGRAKLYLFGMVADCCFHVLRCHYLHARVFDANPDGFMHLSANRWWRQRRRNLVLAIANGNRILSVGFDGRAKLYLFGMVADRIFGMRHGDVHI